MSNSDSNSNSNSNKGGDDFFDHFCQNLRRFTDQHISSMLHSLIGLPSMVTPPAGQSWIIIDEELRPKKERAYSDGDGRLEGKTMEEIQSLKATWIAERDANGGGIETVEGDKPKAEPIGPSSSPSSSAGLGSGRAVYVFRFPSSSSRDYSDYYSPDAYRQIERLDNSHFIRSFYANELFPFSSPFQSFFGLLHPFMFSPSAGLPRYYQYYGHQHPREEEEPEDLNPWRRMRDEERRWRRKVYRYYDVDQTSLSRTGDKMNSGIETTVSNEETQQGNLLPPPSVARSEPAIELDMYEHLDAMRNPPSSFAPGESRGSRIISTSTSTESRTLPDGSTFTKTVRITRYDDGTEEKVENEQSTPPKYRNEQGGVQGNIQEITRRSAQREEGTSEDSPSSTVASHRDWIYKEEVGKTNDDLELMSQKMFDFLMRSPFFGDEEPSPRSAVSKETSEKEKNSLQNEQSREKVRPVWPSENHVPQTPGKGQSAASEEKSGGAWGWFWKK